MKKPGKVLIWLAIVPILSTVFFSLFFQTPEKKPTFAIRLVQKPTPEETDATVTCGIFSDFYLCLDENGTVIAQRFTDWAGLKHCQTLSLTGLPMEEAVVTMVHHALAQGLLDGNDQIRFVLKVTENTRTAWEAQRISRELVNKSFALTGLVPEKTLFVNVSDHSYHATGRLHSPLGREYTAVLNPDGQLMQETWKDSTSCSVAQKYADGLLTQRITQVGGLNTTEYYRDGNLYRRYEEKSNGGYEDVWFDNNGTPISSESQTYGTVVEEWHSRDVPALEVTYGANGSVSKYWYNEDGTGTGRVHSRSVKDDGSVAQHDWYPDGSTRIIYERDGNIEQTIYYAPDGTLCENEAQWLAAREKIS